MEALIVRGRSQNKKWEKREKVRSKSRLGKDECAFCHEKGHWKKVCPKLKKKDKGKVINHAWVIEPGGDSSVYELCLVVIKLLLILMNGFWIRVVPFICVHIRNGTSSILMKLMVELFIWVVVMLAISLE